MPNCSHNKFSASKSNLGIFCCLCLLPSLSLGADKDAAALKALIALIPSSQPVSCQQALTTSDDTFAPLQAMTASIVKSVNDSQELKVVDTHVVVASVYPQLSDTIHSALLSTIPSTLPQPLKATACESHLDPIGTLEAKEVKPLESSIITASVYPQLSTAIHNALLSTLPSTLPQPLKATACESPVVKTVDIVPSKQLNDLTLASVSEVLNAQQITMPEIIATAFSVKLHHALIASLAANSNKTPIPESILIRPRKSYIAMLTDRAVYINPVVSDVVTPLGISQEPTLTANAPTNQTSASFATSNILIPIANDAHVSNAIINSFLQPIKIAISFTTQLATAQPVRIKRLAQNDEPPIETNGTLPATLSEASKLPKKDILSGSAASAPSMAVPEYVIIRPSDRVTFSSETSASVSKINVKEGNTFEQDSILLELDCRVQEAELAKTLAQQQSAHMAMESAKRLKSYGSISGYEFTQALTQDAMASAEVKKLRAVVEKCTIRAPFKGAVSDVLVHEHETVKPGDPLLKIVSTDNLDFELQIPSTWLQWIHIGSIFDVHVNELNESVTVSVTKINPQIDSISQTVRVIGSLTEPNEKLLPGMSGQAIFRDNPDNSKKDASNT